MTSKRRVFKPQQTSSVPGGVAGEAIGTEAFRRLGLVNDHAELVKQIHRGFRVAVIEKLADELCLPQQTLLKVTKIAPATLTRRRKSASGLLSSEESDRVYRIAAAYRSALQLFEGEAESARRWLNEPAKALGNNSPLQHLDTEAGAAEVRDLIGRLEHGVYT
ncbi:MAG: type II RES/Xre toxin-antitoxin system antitoxin [Gammaproteobacteria bacterium]